MMDKTDQNRYFSEYWKLAKEKLSFIRAEWKLYLKSTDFPSPNTINQLLGTQFTKGEVSEVLWHHLLSSLCIDLLEEDSSIVKNPIYQVLDGLIASFLRSDMVLPPWTLTDKNPYWFDLLVNEPTFQKRIHFVKTGSSRDGVVIDSVVETMINFSGVEKNISSKLLIEEWGTEGYFSYSKAIGNQYKDMLITCYYTIIPFYYRSIFLDNSLKDKNLKSVFPNSLSVENFSDQLNLFDVNNAEKKQIPDVVVSQLPLLNAKNKVSFFDTYFKFPRGTSTDNYQLLYYLERNKDTLKASCIFVDHNFFSGNDYFWEYLKKLGDCWVITIEGFESEILIWKPSKKGKVFKSTLSVENLDLLPTAHIANLSPIAFNPWQTDKTSNSLKIWDSENKGVFLRRFPCISDSKVSVSGNDNLIHIQDFPFLSRKVSLDVLSQDGFEDYRMVWHPLNDYFSRCLVIRYAPDQMKAFPVSYIPTTNLIGGKGITFVFPLSWRFTGDNISDHALGRFRAYYHEYYKKYLNQNTSTVQNLLEQLLPLCKKLPALKKRFLDLESCWLELLSKENNDQISEELATKLSLLEQKAFQIGKGAIDKKVFFEKIFKLSKILKDEINLFLKLRGQAYLRYNGAVDISKEDIYTYTVAFLLLSIHREEEDITDDILFVDNFYQYSQWGKDAINILNGDDVKPLKLIERNLQPNNLVGRKWQFRINKEENTFYLDDSFIVSNLPDSVFRSQVNTRNIFDLWRKKRKASLKDQPVTVLLLERLSKELSILCSCIDHWEQLLNKFNEYEDLP